MPGKVKVKIISGKNLPVMDRSSDTTDAYVEIKLGNTTYKTDVCRRTLNPQWNTDWFRFEVDDSELQDEPLQVRLMDHDTYSANDAIGKVYLNLNPLLLPVSGQFAIGDNNPHHEISGWIPVFDTMHGIRGEVNVTVKVELFSDFNRFRQSSCGFHFFYSSTIPQGYQAKVINGFVEELIVNDDPEYQWIDKIRTPRASNEARQTLFLKLSGELQRKIGLKAHGLGGNAVIGYKQNFDLEGESGIVARGIGTAVTLVKSSSIPPVTTESKDELIDNYLKFVGDGKSFSFGSTSPLLQKLPPFLKDTQNSGFPNLSNLLITKRQAANSNISPSLSNPDLHGGQTSIRVLLNQEDKKGLSAMSRRLQKFKHSQKSLSKKIIALKAKLNDSIGEEIEESQEVARNKRSLFKRATSDSSGMAEILARSVMKATSSLSSILEDHPVEDETLKKLDPIANLLHQSESDMGSDAQSSDSDTTSSSDYEYTDYNKNNNDVETISNIIINVEKLQRCLSREALHKQYSLPCIPTKGFSFSSIDKLEGSDYEKYRFGALTKNLQRGSSSSFSTTFNSEFGEDFIPSKTVQRSHKMERSNEIDLPEGGHEHDQKELIGVVSPVDKNYLNTKENDTFSHKKNTDTALEITHIERAKFLGPIPLKSASIWKDDKEFVEEPKGLVKTALQTMLAERAKIMDSDLLVTESCLESPVQSNQVDLTKPNTITNIALQTMLVERANIMGTDADTNQRSNSVKSTHKIQLESTGLVKTALQTMLAEKANIVNTVSKYAENEPRSKNPLNLSLRNEPISRFRLDNVETPNSSLLPSEFEYHQHVPLSLSSSSILKAAFEYPPPTTDEVKVIAKVNLDKVNVQSNKIVKTAMQTMLLEKFNLLGTYTPPTSPSLLSINAQTFTFNDQNQIRSIPKSASAASFGEYQTPRETVLGMPFKSLSSLLTEYESGVQQRRFSLITDQNNDGAKKKRFKFLQSNGKMFQKFNRLSRRDPKETNILSRMFQQRSEGKFKDADTQTSNENLTQNSTSNFICPTKIIVTSYKPPGELDLASGDFLAHSKTKSACITSHNSSPAQERQDENDTEKKNELSPSHGARLSHSPVKVNYMVPIHRRSSDSDLSITPKGNSLTGSDKSTGNAATYLMRSNYARRHMKPEPYDMLEYPFMTMTKFPSRFIIQIGGSISARSVKLLERISNVDEPQSRDTWWSEIRMEIRSHARSLNCNAVLGYTELTSICDDVCVLSAYGTAAIIDVNNSTGEDDNVSNVYSTAKTIERDKSINGQPRQPHDSPDHIISACYVTHVPYDEKGVPLKAKVSKCPMCLVGKVPEVLISTIEPPETLPSVGKGCFIESHVSRVLKDLRGETIAKEISDGLPFLEYELHRLLVNRLKIKGMNAIFGLKIRISVGEKILIGVATGTAIFLPSLPSPDLPLLVTDKVSDEKFVADLQEILNQTVKKNKEMYQIKDDNFHQKGLSDEDSDDEQASLDISCGNKDCCILEMDDPDDAEVLRLLVQEKIPDGFHVVSTESVPGLEDLEIVKNLQMFTQIYRAKLTHPYNLQKHFVRLLQSVYFKLRRMVPCALCDLQFRIDVPEPEEIQLYVIGMALGLGKKSKKGRVSMEPNKTDDDLIFKLDDEQPPEGASIQLNKSNASTKFRSHRSPSKHRSTSVKLRNAAQNERHGVDITPLSYVPGGHIEQYLGNLNFFFIRETNSIREEGGLSGFIHSFMTEVLAIVRSHVTALGGNALVAFFMTECVLNHSLHKNQGQCLINVGGDVVSVSYFKEDIQ